MCEAACKKLQVIYIMRNPKDTSVSYYHYARMLKEFNYKRPFDEFLERYLQGDGKFLHPKVPMLGTV